VTVLLVVGCALLGLLVGSFLNVVIWRVPRSESVVRPGSHCPRCGAQLRAVHNVPVMSWLALRGRCASCGEPISWRYPAVELATAVLFGAVAWRVQAYGLSAAVPAYLYFVAIGVALAAIDVEHKRLPNVIVLPSYGVLAALLIGAAAWQHCWPDLLRAGLGACVLLAVFLALALAYPAGMGWGDVKLAGLLGGVLGYLSWPAVALGSFTGFLLGSIIGVAVIASGRGSRKTAIPFGPFMIAGALLAIFLVDPVWSWYRQLGTGG
jgi:leader peptidase (prepilin peptidase) / N-methyltransferase